MPAITFNTIAWTAKLSKWLLLVLGLVASAALAELQAQTWQVVSTSPGCNSFVCSGDGRIIYALSGDNDTLVRSTNGGVTWTLLLPGAGSPVSCSEDGTKIAVGQYPSVSTNSGASFTQEHIYGYPFWSPNGNMLVAIGDGAAISTNNGATWTTNLRKGTLSYGSLSADGRVIAVANQQSLYISTNSGSSWSAGLTLTNATWSAVACTADGAKIVGVELGQPTSIFVSKDSGASWSYQVPSGYHVRANSYFYSIISSADGSLLVADIDLNLYISRDFGSSWIPDITPCYASDQSVACSTDGTLLVSSSYGDVAIQYLPPPLSIVPFANQLTLFWPAPSSQYTLQYAADLTSSNWLGVTNAITVTNYRNQVTVAPPAAGNAFYRLQGPNQ